MTHPPQASSPPPPGDFGSLFEFLPIGAYRAAPGGALLRANPALVQLNGYASEAQMLAIEQDIGRTWYVLPERRAQFRALLETEGRVVGFESEVRRHRSGERIWVRENAHAVRDDRGRLLYYEGTVEEITERMRAREAARASREQLQQILALVPGLFYRVIVLPDGRRRATFISPGSLPLLGYPPEALLADGMLMHRLRHPDDEARVRAETEAAIAERRPWTSEYRMRCADGSVKWVQAISAPAPEDDDGHEVRIGFVFDISHRKQAEALRIERDRAAAADVAKSQFLSRVSHELRTPLNAILGFAQLLELEPGTGARQQGWLQQVLASGRHLLALMDDILDISSAQSGELRIATDRLPLKGVVDEVLAMVDGSAREAGVALEADWPHGGDELAVRADRKRLKQVVSNLLSNAIKYNRRGGWVRLSSRADAQGVELHVADSGSGLSAAQRERLFQPFERLGAQRGPVAGTGLGLALSRQLAEAMGGSLDVLASAPGVGSTFALRLPAG